VFPDCARHDVVCGSSRAIAGPILRPLSACPNLVLLILRLAKNSKSSLAQEMKAGKDKVSVLNAMGERCGVQ